jgi:serine/threonine protein kinase
LVSEKEHVLEILKKDEYSEGITDVIQKERTIEGIAGIQGAKAVWEDGTNTYILRDHFPSPNLAERALSLSASPMDADLVKFIAIQLIDAVSALHKRNYIHRDVRLANILFDRDGKPILGGLGSVVENGQGFGDVGAPEFWSPEQWRGDLQTALGDSFQIGYVLFVLVTGRVSGFTLIRLQIR